jgi:hypothetical protein
MLKTDDNGDVGIGGFVLVYTVHGQIIEETGERAGLPTQHRGRVAGMAIRYP